MTKAFVKKDNTQCEKKIIKSSCKATLPAASDKSCCCKSKKTCACDTADKCEYTTIIAEYDVGFGNTLFVRGEGTSCFSWDNGAQMENVGANHWKLQIPASSCKDVLEVKFLINDLFWSEGENFKISSGKVNHVIVKF